MACAMWCHSPERVPSVRPARRPATDTSLTGEASRQHADPRYVGPVHGGDVTEVEGAGPVPGQDARGVGVDLGVPGQGAAEGSLDAEVKAAVAGT
ncbi:MAG: hypothetical protein QOF84_6380 [Streptomyces sp.]|nr:hypothetical protein [Streptomyces sp.]